MRHVLAALAVTALAACSPSADQPQRDQASTRNSLSGAAIASKPQVPAGAYTLDKAHASLIFRVNHIGFSNYTGRFDRFDAQLNLDPANPAASSVTATIDPRSLGLENPPAGFLDTLLGPTWLAVQFPQMTFRSTRIELTGANTARIIGDFNFHGVARSVVLEATFNGGYAGHPMDPHARIGFSAHGWLKRSQFGVAEGVPPPGSTIGVGDDVEIQIEAEFNGPAWTASQS